MTKILIVEDVAEMSALLALVLGAEGYEIFQAFDSTEAMRRMGEQELDLILMDVMLPGTDGFEIAKSLKSRPETRNIPIVFITSQKEMSDVMNGLELGVDYIVKPFVIPDVVARVKNVVQTFCPHRE